jgi:uncharacterized membrane protein YfcA
VERFATVAAGLLIGGVIGAPIGAWLVRHMRSERIVTAAGALLLLASVYGFLILMVEPAPSFRGF